MKWPRGIEENVSSVMQNTSFYLHTHFVKYYSLKIHHLEIYKIVM